MSELTRLGTTIRSVLQNIVDRAIEAGSPPNQENAVMLAERGIRIPAELLPEDWQLDLVTGQEGERDE